MKLSNHHINALAKKLFQHNQGIQRAKLMHPSRDWLIGVLVGIMIMLVMIGWSVYTYLEKRDAIELSTANVEAEIPAYSADAVAGALELFAKREELFAQLNRSNAPTTEPTVDVVASTTASSTVDEVEAEQVIQAEVIIQEDIDQTDTSFSTPLEPTGANEESFGTPTLID